jgi:uncharacterized membrane protein YfcA
MDVWILIAGVAVLTSVLSAVAGLGGGVILLAVLAQFFPPVVAIPIHGAIQFVSNGSRALSLRPHIAWPVVGWSVLPLLPASLIGAALTTAVPETATRAVLGLFLLILVWRPQWLRFEPAGGLSNSGLVGVGAVSGFLNTTVGASGPFTSPFLRAVTAGHMAFVATAATAQIAAHGSKLVAYGLNGANAFDHLLVIVGGASGAVLGTLIGTRVLGSVDDRLLGRVFTAVLTVLALRLLYVALIG